MESERAKKVIAFIGSPQQRATYRVIQEFEANLKSFGGIDFEYVLLKDCHLELCRGCCLCFEKGEEYCPARDDRDALLEKLDESDGVIFATPTYSGHVTGLMKNFIDRLAFVFHRPRFFGKTFTPIVTYGIFGIAAVVKYLETAGEALGFDVTRGCSLHTLEPSTKFQQEKNSREIKKAAARFYKGLMRQKSPTPSFFRLMLFRLSRTSIRLMLDEKFQDYRHYRDKGWFESDYWHDVSLGLIKRLAGRFFDLMGERTVKQRLGA